MRIYGNLQRRKEKFQTCIYYSKKNENEQPRKQINQDLNGNRKLFWKEASKVNGGKVESCNRIKDGNGKLSQGEVEIRMI